MEIRVIFQVVSFRNLVCRECWLDKADAEVRSLIDGELNRINFSNTQGKQLKKVCLLICKYTTKKLNPQDVANFIAWNCTMVNVM